MELSDVRCLAVLGLRRSGLPAALLARRELAGVRVVALDEGDAPPKDAVAELRAAGIEVLCGADALLPDGADLLVKSPGVPDESRAVQEALRRGVTLWSEVEFAARFLPNRVLGITGTNGKTTTTELAGAIFRDAGLPVAVGGNVGYALAGMPGEIAADAAVVAELSSFQLEHIERFRPEVAVLLNLTEDHIDRHGTYRGYADAKLRIFENQTDGDVALLCADDQGVLSSPEALKAGLVDKLAAYDEVLDELKLEEPKTKDIANMMKALNIESAVMALPEVDDIIIKSARNLPRVKTMAARQLNVADMLSYDKLLMTEAALRQVEELWGGVA